MRAQKRVITHCFVAKLAFLRRNRTSAGRLVGVSKIFPRLQFSFCIPKLKLRLHLFGHIYEARGFFSNALPLFFFPLLSRTPLSTGHGSQSTFKFEIYSARSKVARSETFIAAEFTLTCPS